MQQFVDLQVNGYAGVDFNHDDVQPDALHRACELLQEHQVRAILATITTEDVGKMCARLSNLVRARVTDPLVKSIIAGVGSHGERVAFLLDLERVLATHELLDKKRGPR